ncbi:MAG: hypothetical protein RLZZ08_1013 [Pseudomonadota bacterium]|jgi:opacity protein-like surface antigen
MALKLNMRTSAIAALAGFAIIASPVAAAPLQVPHGVTVRDAGHDAAAHGGYGRGGWGRHHDRVDGGDIFAGLLILGGIVAVASAVDHADQQRDYPVQDRPEPGYRRAPQQDSGYQSGGMDRAVDMCVDAVEQRGAQVGDVDGANRGAQGWFISGSTDRGAPWSCHIGPDGQMQSVEVGDNSRAEADGRATMVPASGQYDDAFYARARQSLGQVAYVPPQPARE